MTIVYINKKLRAGTTLQKTEFAWIYFFQAVFLFAQFMGFMLSRFVSIEKGLSLKVSALVFVLAAVAAGPLAYVTLRILNAQKVRKVFRSAEKGGGLPFCVILLALLLLWLPSYLAFFPGITAYDIQAQWSGYISSELSTHHPIAHTLLMCGIIQMGKEVFSDYNTGIAIYSFLQLAALAGGVAYCLYTVQKLRLPKWLFCLSFAYFALFPLFPILGVSSTKDIFFSTFFLVAFCLAMEHIETGRTSKLVLYSVFLALSMLFRNNAIYSVVATVILLALTMLSKSCDRGLVLRLMATGLAASLICTYALATLQNWTQAEDGSSAEMLSVPCQQIARVYRKNWNELSEEDLNEMYAWIYYSSIPQYRQEIADPVKNSFNDSSFRENPMDFFRMWLSLGMRFPATYIEAFLYNSMPLWYLGDDSLFTIKHYYLEMRFEPPFGTDAHEDGKLPAVESWYRKLMQEGGILHVPLLSLLALPSLYTWLVFFSLTLLAAKRKVNAVILPALPLLYLATLLLGPCILPRYCFPAILCTPPLLCYVVHLGNKNREKKVFP